MLQDLHYTLNTDEDKIALLGHALSAPVRLSILKILAYKNPTIKEISMELKLPLNTLLNHLSILESAGIVGSRVSYTSKGKVRTCYRLTDKLSVALFDPETEFTFIQPNEEIKIPVGSFFDFSDLSAPCGMASAKSSIGQDNDLRTFLASERHKASIIWFTHGFLEYRIPLPLKENIRKLKAVEISLEACSEAPLFNNDYKSDISLYLNDVLLGTHTCPGDFGDRRGLLNPEFWPMGLTQYGEFMRWSVTPSQTLFNNKFLSYVALRDLNLGESSKPYLSLKIGVDPNAEHVGGINLFGKYFGDYPQDIIVKYLY